MSSAPRRSLRILIADEAVDTLGRLAGLVEALGHEVVARETEVAAVGTVTAALDPDVALVALGPSSDHALAIIERIVREAACPVIVLLPGTDPAFVREAARRGVFCYVVDGREEDLQSALDVTLERFAEYQALQGAFGRRAIIEQAKGIIMARRGITADAAFALLREQSQRGGRRVHELAQAIVDVHGLLAPPAREDGMTAELLGGERVPSG